jgi:hypothetical protein
VYDHRLLDATGVLARDIGRSDWADWSHSGELLFAREGRVYRVVISPAGVPGEPEELIDLRELRFEQVPPPKGTITWGEPVKGRKLR